MWLNLLIPSLPDALFAAIGIWDMIRQPTSVYPRSRLIALAGIAISATPMACVFWHAVRREYAGYLIVSALYRGPR